MKVIAYLHTHWDREWYREFEVFRLRLLRVFDNVLDMLEQNKIPSFYFDGQVAALLDYLELRPEKEPLIRKFIRQKRLFIGPFYCLVDEFLTDDICFKKNLEIGLKISKDFGCEDFLGYFADTFGHSQNIPKILKEFSIDKAAVWRGVGDLPSEFIFCGVNTVNLVRGYFNDIFSQKIPIGEKAQKLKHELDLIKQKSNNCILLPIGVEPDIKEQIDEINKINKEYEIVLGSPFDYFREVEFKTRFDDELRDNSKTFILSGCYSARLKLKQYNTKCSYLLNQADKLQQKYGAKYKNAIEYAYKLLLQNQAHDSICGCSTDMVHEENITRYKKILQIANTIIEELRLVYKFETPIIKSPKIIDGYEVIEKHNGFENSLLYDTQKIPVTEDYTTIYALKKKPEKLCDIPIVFKDGKIFIKDIEMRFTRRNDAGDTYNFAPAGGLETAQILSFENDVIKTSFFDVVLKRSKNLLNFKIDWQNDLENKLWQVKFILKSPVTKTFSEDMGSLIERTFAPDYNMAENLPQTRGIEVKTNFAPMQRYVGAQGFGIITQGLTEYEVYKNELNITILRSTGVISNPENPARTTPAGPPIEVIGAQQFGKNTAEFSVGFFEPESFKTFIEEVFPPYC